MKTSMFIAALLGANMASAVAAVAAGAVQRQPSAENLRDLYNEAPCPTTPIPVCGTGTQWEEDSDWLKRCLYSTCTTQCDQPTAEEVSTRYRAAGKCGQGTSNDIDICGMGTHWDDVISACTVNACGSDVYIPHGGSDGQAYTSSCAASDVASGDNCTLSCSTSGWSGSTIRTCTAGAYASLAVPACTANACGSDVYIADGGSGNQAYTSSCAASDVASGANCTLTCSTPGWSGSTTRTCTAGAYASLGNPPLVCSTTRDLSGFEYQGVNVMNQKIVDGKTQYTLAGGKFTTRFGYIDMGYYAPYLNTYKMDANGNVYIGANEVLVIPAYTALWIPEGTSIYNYGTIKNNGVFYNDGAIKNMGTFDNAGQLLNWWDANTASSVHNYGTFNQLDMDWDQIENNADGVYIGVGWGGILYSQFENWGNLYNYGTLHQFEKIGSKYYFGSIWGGGNYWQGSDGIFLNNGEYTCDAGYNWQADSYCAPSPCGSDVYIPHGGSGNQAYTSSCAASDVNMGDYCTLTCTTPGWEIQPSSQPRCTAGAYAPFVAKCRTNRLSSYSEIFDISTHDTTTTFQTPYTITTYKFNWQKLRQNNYAELDYLDLGHGSPSEIEGLPKSTFVLELPLVITYQEVLEIPFDVALWNKADIEIQRRAYVKFNGDIYNDGNIEIEPKARLGDDSMGGWLNNWGTIFVDDQAKLLAWIIWNRGSIANRGHICIDSDWHWLYLGWDKLYDGHVNNICQGEVCGEVCDTISDCDTTNECFDEYGRGMYSDGGRRDSYPFNPQQRL